MFISRKDLKWCSHGFAWVWRNLKEGDIGHNKTYVGEREHVAREVAESSCSKLKAKEELNRD